MSIKFLLHVYSSSWHNSLLIMLHIDTAIDMRAVLNALLGSTCLLSWRDGYRRVPFTAVSKFSKFLKTEEDLIFLHAYSSFRVYDFISVVWTCENAQASRKSGWYDVDASWCSYRVFFIFTIWKICHFRRIYQLFRFSNLK